MNNPIVQLLIAALTSYLTTGSASITIPPQTVDIGGQNIQVDEVITVKKV